MDIIALIAAALPLGAFMIVASITPDPTICSWRRPAPTRVPRHAPTSAWNRHWAQFSGRLVRPRHRLDPPRPPRAPSAAEGIAAAYLCVRVARFQTGDRFATRRGEVARRRQANEFYRRGGFPVDQSQGVDDGTYGIRCPVAHPPRPRRRDCAGLRDHRGGELPPAFRSGPYLLRDAPVSHPTTRWRVFNGVMGASLLLTAWWIVRS